MLANLTILVFLAFPFLSLPGPTRMTIQRDLLVHGLPLIPGRWNKKLMRLRPEWEDKRGGRKRIWSLFFISHSPEWLTNILPVPKKDGKVRMFIDFRNLNNASPQVSHSLIERLSQAKKLQREKIKYYWIGLYFTLWASLSFLFRINGLWWTLQV